MNPRKTCSILSAASALMLAPAAFGQNGTWAITSNGSWGSNANWSGGTIAGNSTSTAFFNNVDIPAGNTTVTLDGNRTINKLVFGDTATGTAGAWIIAAGSPAGTLTLAGTTPAITTNVTTTITARLQGTNGFTKDGPGTLILNYTDNATNISGNVVVSAGTLNIQSKTLTNATSVAINGGTLVSATTTANAIGGTISFGGGTLQFNQNPGTDYSAQFSTAANQQYRINVITAAGPIDRVATFSTNLSSEGGTLTKLGTGVLILNAANTFNGATTVSAGTLQLNNALALQNSPINTTGSITGNSTVGIILNGVTTPTFGGLTGNKNLASLFNSSTGNYTTVTDLKLNPGTGADYSYSGVIANGASGMTLTKTGEGTQRLSGNNTYAGNTTVSNGTLLVNNITDSGTGSGTVIVESGATLGGTGTISGAVNVSGVLSPGESIESLGAGTLTLNNGSTFKYEINSATVGADLLHVTGGLNIGSNVTLDLTDLANVSQALALGTKFTLISYTGTWNGGTFSGYTDEAEFTFAGNEWRIDYDNDGVDSLNFTDDQSGATGFVTITVIPEPASAGLLGLGGLAALLARRRRRN